MDIIEFGEDYYCYGRCYLLEDRDVFQQEEELKGWNTLGVAYYNIDSRLFGLMDRVE